jgi:hypothetical protein
MNEQGTKLQPGALADGQPGSSVRKPWHTPQVILSKIDKTATGGASNGDGVGTSS